MDTKVTEELIRLLEVNRDVLAKVHEVLSGNEFIGKPQHGEIATLLREEDSISRGRQISISSHADDAPQATVPILQPATYNLQDFEAFLQSHPWRVRLRNWLASTLVVLRQEATRNSNDPSLLTLGLSRNAQDDPAKYTHFDIFDVDTHGKVAPIPGTLQSGLTKPDSVWTKLALVNPSNREVRAHGRVILLREPSPLIFAILYYTLKSHFDIDEIFHMLTDHKEAITVHPHRAFSEDPRRQRTFVLRLSHLTCVGKSREPLEWQPKSDDVGWLPKNHQLSRCTVVLALSFEGDPLTFIKNNQNRRAPKSFGLVYDPLSAWRLLCVEMCPDWHSDIQAVPRALERGPEDEGPIYGPEAFLVALLAALRDVISRLDEVYTSIASLCTPEPDSIFRRELQDQLLFDDEHFTFSRRYLMAHQTLGIVNQDIDCIVSSTKQTLSDYVSRVGDKIVWPPNSAMPGQYRRMRRKLQVLKRSIEVELVALKDLEKLNVTKQQDMKALFDNLYNMTSIQENRRSVRAADAAVQQNRNIKLLTLVTIFFLPLSFVTSIYGMNNIPPEDDFRPYAWTTVSICVPTYLLIASLTPSRPFTFWRTLLRRGINTLSGRSESQQAPEDTPGTMKSLDGTILAASDKGKASAGKLPQTQPTRSSKMASLLKRMSVFEEEEDNPC